MSSRSSGDTLWEGAGVVYHHRVSNRDGCLYDWGLGLGWANVFLRGGCLERCLRRGGMVMVIKDIEVHRADGA